MCYWSFWQICMSCSFKRQSITIVNSFQNTIQFKNYNSKENQIKYGLIKVVDFVTILLKNGPKTMT